MDKCWWVNVKRKSEIKMTSATVCISQTLTSNHFISRSHPLQSFRLFAAFHSPFFDGTSKWRFLFSVCLSSTYLSICRLISLLSLFFFLSPSLSLCYQGIGVGVRVISVLRGNFRGTGGWYGLNRLSHSLFVWVSYQVQHVSSFFFAFPVNHSPVVLTEINQCI